MRGPTAIEIKERALRRLHELVAALDRRVAQVERAGEAEVTRDAAALREKALKRISEIESDI
jgi:hypothetical protein